MSSYGWQASARKHRCWKHCFCSSWQRSSCPVTLFLQNREIPSPRRRNTHCDNCMCLQSDSCLYDLLLELSRRSEREREGLLTTVSHSVCPPGRISSTARN